MSELKVLLATPHPKMKNACDGAVEVYLKSDADKVIAELKERLDTTEKLLNKALNGISNGNKHMMSLARKKNHADYKRCLAMAEACMHKRWRPDEGFDYARSTRHMKKWLEIAEKFKFSAE